MARPVLYLTVGLPGTGKTTYAREIERSVGALRLSKDEWMKALYGLDNPSEASDVVEGRLIGIGLRALELGSNVVIDFGLWSRDERSSLRHAAHDVGADVVMQYCELDRAEQRRRLDRRLADAPHETWPISDEELDTWSASFDVPTSDELEGREPISPPPGGFPDWYAWMAHRWPAALRE